MPKISCLDTSFLSLALMLIQYLLSWNSWRCGQFHLRTFWSPPLSCYSRLHCDRILSSVATSMTLANAIDFGYSVESVSFANLMWHIPSNILSGWYIPAKWNIYCWHDLARWVLGNIHPTPRNALSVGPSRFFPHLTRTHMNLICECER